MQIIFNDTVDPTIVKLVAHFLRVTAQESQELSTSPSKFCGKVMLLFHNIRESPYEHAIPLDHLRYA